MPCWIEVDKIDVSLEYRIDPENAVLHGRSSGELGYWYHPWSMLMRGGLALVLLGTTNNGPADVKRFEKRTIGEDTPFTDDTKLFHRLADLVRRIVSKKNRPLLAMANIPVPDSYGFVRISEIPKYDANELIVHINYFESTDPIVDNPRYYLIHNQSSNKRFVESIEQKLRDNKKNLVALESCFEPPWYLTADPIKNKLYFSKFSNDIP